MPLTDPKLRTYMDQKCGCDVDNLSKPSISHLSWPLLRRGVGILSVDKSYDGTIPFKKKKKRKEGVAIPERCGDT
jgi:hypothetical protein